ncbi:MAG: hypothetical protein WAV23_04055 [Minisyncoccia bacterium]
MNIENFIKPIESKSVEEHESILDDKISEIRLQYIDLLSSGKIPPLEQKVNTETEEKKESPVDSFEFLLSKYTSILRDLMGYYVAHKKNEGAEWVPYMYDSVEAQFKNKIIEFHEKDKDHWIEKTMQLLGEECEKAESSKKEEIVQSSDLEDNSKYHGMAGLITFDVDGHYKYWFNGSQMPSPVEDSDTCMSIHLDPLFKKTLNSTDTNIFSSNSLQKLAVKIVDDFPETKAILAHSWLMDTPIAERIGFKIYKRENYSEQGSFWSQFINSNGQIDKERVKKFLETGKAPYSVALGAMTTEDFLRKYLPPERRGKIILKEVNPDFDEKIKKEAEIIESIFIDLNKITEEEIEKRISKCEIYSKFLKTEQGSGLIELIKELKEKGESAENIREKGLLKKYQESSREYIKGLMYTNKEVII